MSKDQTYDFTETLQDLDAGVFVQKLSRAVQEAAEATVYQGDNNKKGKVTVELTMKRIEGSQQLALEHKLIYEKPTRRGKSREEDSTSTALYVGQRGRLSIMPDADTGDMFGRREKEEDRERET